ncbi:hypothetical protein [Rhizobium sp. AP16]|uniref:hypothetical protein n=1 Tax=Rhizobium sp. AP16 TaxID=1144306 RepID=UPI00026ED461|nr:hypothetical protein [Rhizobium sp. AP16]EJK83565.1 hypothetical protein PMI03_03220 [Rhizobium sp. AP16]
MATETPHPVGDDEPVTLAEACSIFFRGRLTKSALRTEARKGNLEILQIAGKDFVTRNAIERMKEKCLRRNDQPGSGSGQTPGPGLSKTGASASAQNALRLKLQQRKQSSQTTSQPNTNQSAAVVPLKSP